MLALLVAGAVIQRQALQPGAVDTDVTGASTKIAQGLLELLNAHETAGQYVIEQSRLGSATARRGQGFVCRWRGLPISRKSPQMWSMA
jgi:hypothetical protein